MKQFFGRFSVSTPHAHFKLFRGLLCPDWTLTGSALGKLAPVTLLCVLFVTVGETSGWRGLWLILGMLDCQPGDILGCPLRPEFVGWGT